jgi:L-alanine-DL-glutamate epimerase-like enolase superfamily enzyme
VKIAALDIERWPYRYPLRITGHEWTHVEVAVVEIEDDGRRGRGECAGVYYRGDTAERCLADIERVADRFTLGVSRRELLDLLPAGGARNALDAALWDLEAKAKGRPVWELVGSPAPQPLLTTHTLGADEPERMVERALAFSEAKALKLKLTGMSDDAERVREVRRARPDVWLGVDANQGFTRASLEALMPTLLEADVRLIEQPFAVGRDADLEGMHVPIELAADESAQDLDDVARVATRFGVINIKLDKCGGLTRALEIEAEARQRGLKVMVGCMGGTSLAMAPAYVLGLRCDLVDLDGPLLLARDRSPAVRYEAGRITCAPEVWGSPAGAVSASAP